ncbi:hypothetical protein BH20ACT8_BH20ACT8_09730 [soil metagenome]
MDNEQVARRLSAALGRRIDAEDIMFADGGIVMTATGVFSLCGGNACFEAGVGWWRNGKRWTPDGVKVRPVT